MRKRTDCFPPTTVLGCDLFVLLNRLAIPAPINRRRHTPQCLAVRFCGRRRRKPGAVAARCPPFDRAALTAVWRQPDPVRLEPVDTAFASRDARPVPIVIFNSGSGTAAVDRLHLRPVDELEGFGPGRRRMTLACAIRRIIDAKGTVLRQRRTYLAHSGDSSRARSGSFWRCAFCVAGVLAAAGVRVRAASRAAWLGRGADGAWIGWMMV